MINAGDSVLVVVDMQNGFVSPMSAHIVEPVSAFAHEWADSELPFVMTRFLNSPDSQYERLIGWNRMQEAPETEIVDALQDLVPRAEAVIDKPIYSPFTDQGEELFRAHGWKNLVIIGIATESCVLKTATDAFERGLIPWVLEDLVYSHAGEEAHQAGLLVTSRFIGRGQIVKSTQVLPLT